MPKKDLTPLFDKFIESNEYKERAEAAKILGYLDKEELGERLQKIVLLNSDNNIAVLLNLLSSIKNILLKYPEKSEELLIYVYIHTEFSNHLVKEFSRQIIDSVNPKVIDNIVVYHTSKLYSKNRFEVVKALLVLGFVSIYSPEYLKNSLPELSMISLYSKSELSKILAQAILDEFENIPKSIIKELKFLIESPDIDENSWDDTNDAFKKLVIINLKKEISDDEFLLVLKHLTDSEEKNAIISAITLKKYVNLLKKLNESENEISEIYPSIYNALENKNEIDGLNAILTSAYIRILVNSNITSEKALKLIKNLVTRYLNHDNYLISSYGLEMLNSFVLLKNSELNLNIEKILENNNFGNILRYNSLNYYSGIKLIANLGLYDIVRPEISPYFNESLVNEYAEVPKSMNFEQFRSLEKKFDSEDWFYRFEIGKKLGNLTYAVPNDIKYSYGLINSVLNDRVYLVRSVGVWILHIILDRGFKIPENLIIESISCFDDPNMEIRQDLAIFYNKLLKKYPEILNNVEIKSKFQSALTTKYFTDRFNIVRTICEDTLKLIPNSKDLIGYESKNLEEKFETLEKALDNFELKRSAVIRLKVKLRSYIKTKDSENILKILEFIDKQDLTEEFFDLFFELCSVKKDFEIAENILNRLKNRFPEVPKSRENIIYGNLDEMIVSRRIDALNEILEYILEGFEIDGKIIKKIKEFAIYPQVNSKITELSLKILEKLSTEESKRIFNEKIELNGYLSKNNLESEVVDVKTQTWKEIYFSLKYLLTQDYKTLNYVNLEFSDFMKFNILESDKNSLIISIILLEVLKNNLKLEDPILMDELEKYKRPILKNISKIILNQKYPLLSQKGLEFLKTVMYKKSSWFEEAVLTSSKSEEYLTLISKLLDENTPQIQVESLETLANLVKLNVKCTDYPDIHEKVLNLISDDKKWIVFRKALEVIYACNFEDKEDILEKVSKRIIDYLKNSNDDSKLFLIKFFKIKGIDKIPDYLFEELKEFENSPNPYISSEIAELIQKRKMGMNF